tara:strand:- start:255 stop:431 length:177 start_codon:yes stop_codon:yes gene_type:complete
VLDLIPIHSLVLHHILIVLVEVVVVILIVLHLVRVLINIRLPYLLDLKELILIVMDMI